MNDVSVIPVIPIFAIYRNIMWGKDGRTLWVLIEEGAVDGCGITFIILILVLLSKKLRMCHN